MINRDNVLVRPGIIEKVIHNQDRFVPDQLVIPLKEPGQIRITKVNVRAGFTSEKAGAAIFLYLFQSSPSDATILYPKNESP
jgi:hypothetical protein